MVVTFITSVVAHIDHGKTTLIDSLIANQGIISKQSAGQLRYMDTRPDEQIRGIILKLSATELIQKDNTHIIIDTPGHVDFESLVQASSFMADNFLVIIDLNEGVTPRLFSIIKHIKDKQAILVINKIDMKLNGESKEDIDDFFNLVNVVICRVNGLLKEEVFDWESNNVILAWSTMCCGVSKNHFKDIVGNKSSLWNVIKFLKMLKGRIDRNEVEGVMKRFDIKKKGDKNILSGVLPLASVVLECIENTKQHKNELGNNTYVRSGTELKDSKNMECENGRENKTNISSSEETNNIKSTIIDIKETELVNKKLFREAIALLQCSDIKNTRLNNNQILTNVDTEELGENTDELSGLTMFSILNNTKDLKIPNLLFAVRLFSGKVKKDDKIFCRNNKSTKECIIKSIYRFGVNEIIPINEAQASTLILVEADLYKHSVIFSNPADDIKLNGITSKPFYNSRIILNDGRFDEFKESLKTLSFLESILNIKINRFNEFEVACEGKVQMEKMCNDLRANGYDFIVAEGEEIFCETILEDSQKIVEINDDRIQIPLKRFDCDDIVKSKDYNNKENISSLIENLELGDTKENCRQLKERKMKTKDNNIDNTYDKEEITKYTRGKNVLLSYNNAYNDIIKSVNEIFMAKGPLISEEIKFTELHIYIKESTIIDRNDLFYILKKEINALYNMCTPTIIPYFFDCKIQILPEYLGAVYNTLHKYFFIMNDETYDEDTDFYIIQCLIPQFVYYNFVEDIRTRSKGTVYLEIKEHGFKNERGFNDHVEGIRQKKGMFIDKKIVEDPEKQRTLKK